MKMLRHVTICCFTATLLIQAPMARAILVPDPSGIDPSGQRLEVAFRSLVSWSEQSIRIDPDQIGSRFWEAICQEAGNRHKIGPYGLGVLLQLSFLDIQFEYDNSVPVDGQTSGIFSIQLRPYPDNVPLKERVDLEKYMAFFQDPGKMELLNIIQTGVARFLNEQHDRTMRHWERRWNQARISQEKATEETEKLHHKLNTLIQEDPAIFMDQERLFDHLQALQEELQAGNVELAVLRARRKAIQGQLEEIDRQAERETHENHVIEQLERVVQLREESFELARTRVEQGMAPREQVSRMEEELAMARAELAKSRQQAFQASGGELLRWLNQERIQTDIHAAELEARQAQLKEQISQAREGLPVVQKIEMLRMELDRAHDRLHQVTEEASKIDRMIHSVTGPAVKVLEPASAEGN